MSQTESTLARFDHLIGLGAELPGWDVRSDTFFGRYHGWQVSAADAIKDVAGEDSAYYQSFANQTTRSGRIPARIGLGILEQLREDIAAGYLRRTADLLAAGVFSDFLEMAD